MENKKNNIDYGAVFICSLFFIIPIGMGIVSCIQKNDIIPLLCVLGLVIGIPLFMLFIEMLSGSHPGESFSEGEDE